MEAGGKARCTSLPEGADGGCPNGGLVFDAAGNLYGASWSGGAYGGGTVFELTPNPDKTWTESVLYDFTGGLDGSVPAAPLIIDAQGDLYGTALYGGTGWGVVFKLTPNSGGTWTQSVLYTFAGTPDLGHAEGNVIFDAAGNLYGTAYEGGSAKCGGGGCGGVFKLAPSQNGTWTESVLHRFNGADGADPQGGLVFDANGDLYGATVWSGHFGGCGNNRCGTIFELTPNPDGTWAIHFPHRFTGGKDGGSSSATWHSTPQGTSMAQGIWAAPMDTALCSNWRPSRLGAGRRRCSTPSRTPPEPTRRTA